jgi:DNA invertase Pin-like site-specific DNA recombinase
MDKKYNTKYVATYLRKSRGEQEDDLEKHRTILSELCDKNNFRYVEYAEIGTSDSIDLRPQMLQLLKDIEEGVFDAVCVVEYDRLGRGDLGEQDRIKKAFQNSDTLIITPDKIYDLNNDLDDTYADFKGMFARQEYKMITKRLRQGKKIGARRGDWTNGTPPFPYEYQKYKDKYNKKGLVVNDEHYQLYREIIEMAIKGTSPNQIAIILNQRGTLTKKGNYWSGVIIQRLLLDETHLGKIISNKTQGDGHKNKKPNAKKVKTLPRSAWIIIENCHESVKTQEEHDIISLKIVERKLVPHRARKQTHTFSGIVRCAKCGHCLTFGINKSNNNKLMLKPCWYKDPIGNICKNGGILFNVFEEAILNEIKNYKDNFSIQEAEMSRTNTETLISLIKEKEMALVKFKKALDAVNDSYELGDYNRKIWHERKKKWEDKIHDTDDEIYDLRKKLKSIPEISAELRQENLNEFFNKINSVTTDLERNNLYKSIIESIIWLRQGDNISIKINYK